MSRPYFDGRRPTNQANRLPSAASSSTATCRYRIGVREFIPTRKHDVSDDHLKLHDVGKIPTCAIIDFDYPYWRPALAADPGVSLAAGRSGRLQIPAPYDDIPDPTELEGFTMIDREYFVFVTSSPKNNVTIAAQDAGCGRTGARNAVAMSVACVPTVSGRSFGASAGGMRWV
jgi:hypothetical protein